ncbi:MAG: peroxide stress protein YaaA [Agathobacter sp.]|nr:peroxide stress protein YaaA [Agathobacter sp.]
MRIILSPTKKMKIDNDSLVHQGLPVFLEQTEEILQWLKEKSTTELKVIWNCNDKIIEQNRQRLLHMKLRENLTPAVLAYEGIAFQYMAPGVFENEQFDYIQEHLRILSAFYGVLKPMDGVTPYRLEMQAKASIGGNRNLYELWGSRLYEEVCDGGVIINLASKEYSKCIEKYLTPHDRYITINFYEKSGDKLVSKGTYAKMARGEMVRYMAELHIENPEEIKKFDRMGYVYREDLSGEKEYVFVRLR